MRQAALRALVLLLFFVVPGLAAQQGGQSVGELARQDRERRKALAEAAAMRAAGMLRVIPIDDIGEVWTLAFSPDGQCLATAGFDMNIRIWDVATAKVLRTLSGHGEKIIAVAFSPDGRWLASASEDKTVKLWNANTGSEVRTLMADSRTALSVAFSPDGTSLAGEALPYPRL